MKNITYILLSLMLVFAGCRKVDKVETYQVEVVEATVTAGTDNVGIEAAYTYDYTLKSAQLQYSDNSGLENAVSIAAQFADGVLKATADGLKPATTYFYRFELDNGVTKMWTETRTFRTLDEPIVTELVVTTAEVSSIADTCAVCGGEVVSEGSSEVIARGVCYGLSENPSLDDCTGKTVDGGGPGAFTSTMTGLEKETKYHVRAYATDNDTTCYGEERTFTTLGQIVYSLPTVITNAVDETTVGQYNATLSGVVTDDGNKPVTGCGFWYSTSHDTLGGITRPAAYSAGGFSLNVSDGIEPGTTYYARAYAENEIGRRLGNEVSFTTLSIPPTPDPQVFTLSSTDVTANSATIKGRVYYDGTENPIKKGFLYGTDINDLDKDADCTSQPDPFEAELTGLTPDTKYYYKAYATFTGYAQTFYGGIESFTTLVEITEPTIHTAGPSNITTTTANSGGYGITDGNSPIIKKGVCWAKSDNPTLDDCLGHTEDGTGTNDFTSEVTGLEQDEDYYVRAYAMNQAGKTGYGEALGLHTMIMHQAPDVTTNQASGITGSSATVSGIVTNSYGCDITECWIIWGDSDNTMTNRLDCEAGTAFSGTLTGLTNEHTYSFRAFAKNEYDETGNGGIEHFTTNNETPDVETLEAIEITSNSATVNGRVNDDHGISIIECWFMWGTNADALTERVGCTPGMTFSGGVDGLQPNTSYYFVAYAKNGNGLVGNGIVKQFITSATLPTVITSEITNITPTTATGGGNVTNDGGATVTARGICWNTSPNPTVSNSHTTDGTGTGTFTSSMTGLTANTTYYVRAYATNSAGTAYGEPKTFTTAQILLPTVITSEITDITQTTATGGGNVTNDGGATVTARGICWSTSPNPTVSDSHTTNGAGTGAFTSSMTGLTANTTYYVRAYATNSAGTAYGGEYMFETTQLDPEWPDGDLPGVFSVSATHHVKFSKGNLQYKASTGTWKLADKQYISIKEGNSNISSTYDGWIDLYGFGTSGFNDKYPYMSSSNNADYPNINITCTNYDWGRYATITNATGEWRTLMQPEWDYLFQTRTNANQKYSQGTVNNEHGLIILPDSWILPSGLNFTAISNNWTTNNYTLDQWNQMEMAGAVFFPTTGVRYGTNTQNTTGFGGYWATNCDDGVDVDNLDFYSNSVNPSYHCSDRYCGRSVRLIRDVETFEYLLVTTDDISNITSTTATSGGMITSFGGAAVTARGICWSTSPNPTVSDPHTSNGTGTGTFTSSMTGLTANTTYYVRAYATNSAGTAYGEPKTFTTAQEDTGNYFCITALDAGTTTVSMAKEGNAPTVHLEYKKNNGEWTAFTVGSTNISLSQNDKVFFKAPDGHTNNRFASGAFDYNYFVVQGGKVKVSGNIIYLLDPTGEKITLASANNYTFTYLFKGCNKLVSANQLSLPATTLADYCYTSMFNGCTSLTTAPDLPATSLANVCYNAMFSGCTSLTTAPDLPATTLADNCYSGMFIHCTSLTTAPDLPATTLADYCYHNMFGGCTSLTTAPDLPATTLADYCYSRMFWDCTSLTTAPDLPATTLADGCYQNMFMGCTSLTTAPDLPATTLASTCYYDMFRDCTSLTTAPDLPATTLADYCYHGMFNGCSNLHYIRMLATENLNATKALYEWVSGVPSTGDFYKKAGANLPSGINGIPYGWTVHNE